MATTNENIRQLLEMLDHPEAYTEQEWWRRSAAAAAVMTTLPSMLMPPGSGSIKDSSQSSKVKVG